MAIIEQGALSRRSNGIRHQALRYVALATLLGVVAYAALYFPYAPGSFPVRVLSTYVRLVARAAAAGVWFFDRNVRALGDLVEGRYSLRIVLDCTALDAHALYAAAVLAFPAPWRRRLLGLAVGSAVVALANIARIVFLYVVATRWPAAFHVLHEEVLQFAIVLTAFLAFLGWVLSVQRRARP